LKDIFLSFKITNSQTKIDILWTASLIFIHLEEIQIGKLAEKKTELIKKITGVLTSVEKRKISEEIKAINNFMVEKVRPLKYELNKKLEDKEEKMKQSKVYTFREFPYCFFSAKILKNLLKSNLWFS